MSLKMNFKKILVGITTCCVMIPTSGSVFADNAKNDSVKASVVDFNVNLDAVLKNELSEIGYQQYLQSLNSEDVSTRTKRGLKKWVVVNSLKSGGQGLGKILSYLSPKNGKLVKEYSYELGSALEGFTTAIEASLVDYMVFELGFSNASARSIAWAICQLAL